MKKILLFILIMTIVVNINTSIVSAEQPRNLVSVEIPTDSPAEKGSTKSSKAIEATKEATDKTVQATKDFTSKAVKATKKATKKTVEATKDFTDKTVEGTKDVIENLNPNKPVTLEGLEGKAKIKTLKNEKKELKAAYNSRIKDINAKIKLTEKSTNLTDAQRQNKVYILNKEKSDLIMQRNAAMEKYNNKIEQAKAEKKKES